VSANPISLAVVAVLAGFGVLLIALTRLVVPGGLLIVLAVIVLAALKMARQWEQAVVLRAGKFLAVRGPGLFWIVPILDNIAALIDTGLRTTQFVAEQTLTKDTVPVDGFAQRGPRCPGNRIAVAGDLKCRALHVGNDPENDRIGAADWRFCCQTAGRRTISCARQSTRRPRIGGSGSGRSRSAMSGSRLPCRTR